MTRPHRPDHDDERLRELLAHAVADIWPADRLAAITARTRERAGDNGSTMRTRSLAVAGAVVTSAAVITAAAWAGGAFDRSPDEPPRAATDTSSTAPSTGPAATTEPTPDPLRPRSSDAEPSSTVTAPAPAPAPATPTPVPDKTGGTSPTPDRAPAGTRAAGIYFTGDGPDGPRLFREFQRVPASDPAAAVNVAVQGRAQDPDYRSSWRGVVDRVTRVSTPATGAQGITVQFPAGADVRSRPAGMSAREARVAVQQLVRTVQAYTQDRAGVAFTVAGETSDALGTVLGVPANGDGRGEFVAAPGLEVLNHVSITSPAEGATVDDTLEANGRASSFEATVPWQIRRDGRVVKEGSVMAEGWLGRLYPWRTRIDVSGLSPGTYTFVAMTSDPSGGAEGPGPHTDTRSFRVR